MLKEKGMDTVIHRAESRGGADHGWLKTRHSFSFANYYDPERMGFGALRVLNDDFVEGGGGFGTHPHENMEIVTVMLDGTLMHRDSVGNESALRAGEVQVMSAGTGIQHSEYNGSQTEPLRFLQIWVTPHQQGVPPRYDQKSFADRDLNTWQTLVSGDGRNGSLSIHQDALFLKGKFEAGREVTHILESPGHGVYMFVLSGNVEVAGKTLNERDAIAVRDTSEFTIRSTSRSELLLIEVPL